MTVLIKEWKSSQPLTVGIEWELQILDRETFQPKDIFDEIYETIPVEFQPFLHKEVYQSMVELVTPPSEDENEAINLLKELLENLKPLAVKKSFHLVGLGTLFLPTERETKINYSERYKFFANQFQEILRDFYIYGIHIHIGFPNAAWALRAFNNLVKFAPILLALSANSIFYKGKNTGIHSWRLVKFEQLPRAGLPPQFENFDQYRELVNFLYQNKVIENIKDLWWHIRLRPDLGTVEIRVFDSLWDLERIKTITRLVRAISAYSETYGDPLLHPSIMEQNWWMAKRYSIEADFIDHQGRKAIKHVAFDLIYKLQDLGIFQKLGYQTEEFLKLLRKPSLAKDIELKAKAFKDLKKVVSMAVVV
jgi:carboxylate-amine ligase